VGWTDLDKNCSLGNLLWPRPTLDWHKFEQSEELPTALPLLDMQNAWIGGNSLCLKLSVAGSNTDDAFFCCLWIPIQSLAITPELPYIVKLVYKDSFSDSNIEGDVGLSIRVLGDKVEGKMEITPVADECGDLANGWRQLSVKIVAPSGASSDMHCTVGMILGFASEDSTVTVELILTLGFSAAHSVAPVTTAQTFLKVIWAAFKLSPPPSIFGKAARFSGVLTWEVGEYFGPLNSLTLVGPEDPKPAWPQGSHAPGFLFFNIYALPHHSAPSIALKPSVAKVQFSSVQEVNSPNQNQNQVYKAISVLSPERCRGTRRIPCILFRFSSIFIHFIEPSRGLPCLCSVKAPFSASHHVCASFLLLNAHQTPRHSGCPSASLISRLFSSDLLE
jgi:mannosyl-glycoprotein endo-beta-N-acetylglucosaminidase